MISGIVTTRTDPQPIGQALFRHRRIIKHALQSLPDMPTTISRRLSNEMHAYKSNTHGPSAIWAYSLSLSSTLGYSIVLAFPAYLFDNCLILASYFTCTRHPHLAHLGLYGLAYHGDEPTRRSNMRFLGSSVSDIRRLDVMCPLVPT